MEERNEVPLAIIGAGPAGLTAAIYALRAGIECEVIEAGVVGGQVFNADRIENYPGFPEPLSGAELAQRMRAQAERLGAKIRLDTVERVMLEGQKKKLELQSGTSLLCHALIVAAGSAPKRLGVPGEGRLWGRGVSYCATCDGNFFRGQRVAVVGGGDSACQEALMLSHLAREVYVIHRRNQFRAQEYLAQRVLATHNIRVVWEKVVEEIEGDKEVKAIVLKDVKTGERTSLAVEGVFIYVGVMPQTAFLEGVVERDEWGYLRAGEDGRTSVPGIFAAGDCRTKPFLQIVTAAADGANAVRSCEIYFIEQGLSAKYV